jgi:phosphoglycolate phosphatase-like HAD superfamily hydrolase
MTEIQKLFVFDFDGVVCDSTDECMVTSWNAWEKWESRSGFRKTVSEFDEEEKAKFRKLRPRVRGAGEYYILCRAFSEGINIENQAGYSQLEADWKEHLAPFKALFFEEREHLRKINLDAWIDLHPVYDGVIEIMKQINDQEKLYIATLKDGKSVRLILEKKGLFIEEEKLLDQAQITSKLQALDYFRGQIGCHKNDMVFIDDNVTHLLDPKSSGYPVYLVTWGSIVDEYLEIAEQNKIPLLKDCKFLFNSF